MPAGEAYSISSDVILLPVLRNNEVMLKHSRFGITRKLDVCHLVTDPVTQRPYFLLRVAFQRENVNCSAVACTVL